jgi:hypothetical protein
LPAVDEVMCAEIAAGDFQQLRSRQKPRLLPAADEVVSAESAAGDFQPMKKGR